MNLIEEYIAELEGNQKFLFEYLHSRLTMLDLDEKIRFKIPFYYKNSWIMYLNPIKNDGLELCFVRANELSNIHDILDFKNRKQVGGIEIYDVKDIQEEALMETVQEAILLDETVKYASKRSKK